MDSQVSTPARKDTHFAQSPRSNLARTPASKTFGATR